MSDLNITPAQLSELVVAIGGLGTAAYGVVDGLKGLWGGPSRIGFGDIKGVIHRVLGEGKADDTLNTLRANWLNGMALTDQKAIAKSLIKLKLTPTSAAVMAAATGADEPLLTSVAEKLRPPVSLTSNDAATNPTGPSMSPRESDEFGRFDVALSALLDQGYQRGDQRYRNCAKIFAAIVAVVLAVVATALTNDGKCDNHLGLAIIAGLLATPLAPVAKDVSSAIQAGAKVAQYWKK